MHLVDLSDQLVSRVVHTCLEREPRAIGILAHGSYATGNARTESDLDLDIFLAGDPTVHYRTWFVDRPDDLPLHISARSDYSLAAWDQEATESEDWAFGLPVEIVHSWVWCSDPALRETLGEWPVLRKPGSEPEIEDMVDALLKMRRAGDVIGTRLQAMAVARYAAPCIVALSSLAPVHDPRGAVNALLTLPVAPDRWSYDIAGCLGLVERATAEIRESAERLVPGVLQMLRAVNPYADPQPDIAKYLMDGTFERIIGCDAGTDPRHSTNGDPAG